MQFTFLVCYCDRVAFLSISLEELDVHSYSAITKHENDNNCRW